MSVQRRRKVTVSLMIPFLVFALFFSIMIWQKYRASRDIPDSVPLSGETGNRSVTLFFSDEAGRLSREARVLDVCNNEDECLKSVLDELLNGPVGELDEPVPDGTKVNAAHIEKHLATIEFNRIFIESMLTGSSAEMLAVYSVVNTVVVNFPAIHKVKINVEGYSDGILHHLDISEPLLPDYSLEQPPVQIRAQQPVSTTKNPEVINK